LDCDPRRASATLRDVGEAHLKDTDTVTNALIKNARKLQQELYKSLTRDRGKEMAAHKRFTLATDIKVYFCDPRNPWQRGTDENTNGLLRQYFHKGGRPVGLLASQAQCSGERF